jgi:hypothetical protein
MTDVGHVTSSCILHVSLANSNLKMNERTERQKIENMRGETKKSVNNTVSTKGSTGTLLSIARHHNVPSIFSTVTSDTTALP